MSIIDRADGRVKGFRREFVKNDFAPDSLVNVRSHEILDMQRPRYTRRPAPGSRTLPFTQSGEYFNTRARRMVVSRLFGGNSRRDFSPDSRAGAREHEISEMQRPRYARRPAPGSRCPAVYTVGGNSMIRRPRRPRQASFRGPAERGPNGSGRKGPSRTSRKPLMPRSPAASSISRRL